MGRQFYRGVGATITAGLLCLGATSALAQQAVLQGQDAFGDWRTNKPGVVRHITAKDLPRPGATPSGGNGPRIFPRPADAVPQVPDGFRIDLFAEGLSGPRILRVAP